MCGYVNYEGGTSDVIEFWTGENERSYSLLSYRTATAMFCIRLVRGLKRRRPNTRMLWSA